jgi:glutathione S-transferase
VKRLSSFAPYILGASFSAADCVAYMHFFMIGQTTRKIYGADMLERFFPDIAEYIALMNSRPHVRRVMVDRESALAAFVALNVVYDG